MQIFPSERPMPAPLICSGCRHWSGAAMHTGPQAESLGRCGRFAEPRCGTARPRCNICWEPAVAAPPVRDSALADD